MDLWTEVSGGSGGTEGYENDEVIADVYTEHDANVDPDTDAEDTKPFEVAMPKFLSPAGREDQAREREKEEIAERGEEDNEEEEDDEERIDEDEDDEEEEAEGERRRGGERLIPEVPANEIDDFDDDDVIIGGVYPDLDADVVSETDAEMADGGQSEDDRDTTAAEARRGKDIQGIPWQRFDSTREQYREDRLHLREHYENIKATWSPEQLMKECSKFEKGAAYYDFRFNTRAVRSAYIHFQLRNLVWATTKHDVYTMSNHAIHHWSATSRKCTEVLNLRGQGDFQAPRGMGEVQISTMCARRNLLIAGGYSGEMVCKNLDQPGIAYSGKITTDENAITNAIAILDTTSGGKQVMTSSNDSTVRLFDADSFSLVTQLKFPWPVNHTALSPNRKLLCVVGDDPQGFLVEFETGKILSSLDGHADFSFASAWHPNGLVVATGNQDTTCRLWDIRFLASAFCTLKGRIGAIRSLRYTSDGQFLAMAEPRDFIHIFDSKQDYKRSQEIDLFGEIAGISFSPDDEAFFIGVSDRYFSSLLEYNRARYNEYYDCFL
ncbi:hypothetical protein CBR_g38480 [Chara braunii]|uniref:Uncharacterized protein n=1 Tax=Chara braunii TaxID=69332 RepID=A0A388JNV4_CHABU|nr:hypothetical protein CBR_g38480 [Chara braunii]|eukprot:GBG59455.1 hypothetical protein CBR_g38480 [Chara braunii]